MNPATPASSSRCPSTTRPGCWTKIIRSRRRDRTPSRRCGAKSANWACGTSRPTAPTGRARPASPRSASAPGDEKTAHMMQRMRAAARCGGRHPVLRAAAVLPARQNLKRLDRNASLPGHRLISVARCFLDRFSPSSFSTALTKILLANLQSGIMRAVVEYYPSWEQLPELRTICRA